MAANTLAWTSHEWVTRAVDLELNLAATQYFCRRCWRHFIKEDVSGALYAVHVGMTRFDRLSDEVTMRWLSDSCPGERVEADFVDINNCFHAGGNGRASTSSSGGPDPRER
jgi:hypothetical protein